MMDCRVFASPKGVRPRRRIKPGNDARQSEGTFAMKRYAIFAVVAPFLGGFLLLIATTVMSGYWTETNIGEVEKIFVVLFSTLLYTYLFGILPALAFAAIDDIICHIRRITPPLRMLIVGALAFAAAEVVYGG